MRAVLSKKYSILKPEIETFLSICATCSMNCKLITKPFISKDFKERVKVDLIDFQSLLDGKYKWILNYQDV